MTEEQDFDREVYKQLSALEAPADLKVRFERLLPWYSEFLRPWLPVDKGARIIDAPCGAGNVLYFLRSAGYSNVTGLDSSPERIHQARALGLPAGEANAIEALEAAPAGSVALVLSVDFLEHLPKAVALRYTRAVHRALAHGGRFVARTPCADGPFGSHDRYNDLTHLWAMTSGVAAIFMHLSGFDAKSVQVLQEAPVPYHWRNRLRLILFRLTTRALGAYLSLCGLPSPRVWTRSMWIVAQKGRTAT